MILLSKILHRRET